MPHTDNRSREARDLIVLLLAAQGLTGPEIGARVGLHKSRVATILRARGKPMGRTGSEVDTRRRQLISFLDQGMTTRQVAEVLGVAVEVVRKDVRQMGRSLLDWPQCGLDARTGQPINIPPMEARAAAAPKTKAPAKPKPVPASQPYRPRHAAPVKSGIRYLYRWHCRICGWRSPQTLDPAEAAKAAVAHDTLNHPGAHSAREWAHDLGATA